MCILRYIIIMTASQNRLEKVFLIENLTKTYHTGEVDVHALRGVSATLYKGEISVVLGPSGSGKSTFLNIIGGLDTPTSGRVMFRDLDLSNAGERRLTRFRRLHVGFVFQFYNLIPSLTALENVALVTEISTSPMRPQEALSLVGLEPRMDHFPAQMSGGEQQRVAIARAIAKNPDVLLCDEPTGALDSTTGRLVLEALTRINDELGTTTVIISHNAVIRQLAHRTFYFADGEIIREEINDKRLKPEELAW
jgi:putative ABC transport system ATP-binding protein